MSLRIYELPVSIQFMLCSIWVHDGIGMYPGTQALVPLLFEQWGQNMVKAVSYRRPKSARPQYRGSSRRAHPAAIHRVQGAWLLL